MSDRRRLSDASRSQLYERIHAVFCAQGYVGASMADIARATGLSKPSLYHHFPGGKPEMAAVLTRMAIAQMQAQVFVHLSSSKKPQAGLERVIDGFADYSDGGAKPCWLMHVATEAAYEPTLKDQSTLVQGQFDDWIRQLASAFESTGMKPKRAERSALSLIEGLYGALQTVRLHGRSKRFAKSLDGLKKSLIPA